jgi:hypothetical protein
MWRLRGCVTPIELAALLVPLDPKKARLDTDEKYSEMIDILRSNGFEPGPLPELVAKAHAIGLDVPTELVAPSPIASVVCEATIESAPEVATFDPDPEGEAADTVPGTRHRRGAYEPDLEAYMTGSASNRLALMTDEGVARAYRNQIEKRIKAGKWVPTIPSHSNWLRNICAKVRKIRKRLPTGGNGVSTAKIE